MIMQLAQAGALTRGLRTVAALGAAGGAGYMAAEGRGTEAATAAIAGGTVLFVTPVVLSKLLTDPKKVRMLREGIESGPKGNKYWAAVRMLTAVNASEKTELQDIQKLGQHAYDFYTRTFEPSTLRTPRPFMPPSMSPGEVM